MQLREGKGKERERSEIEQSGLMIASNDPNRRVKSREKRGEGELRVKGEFLTYVRFKLRVLPYKTLALDGVRGRQKAMKQGRLNQF